MLRNTTDLIFKKVSSSIPLQIYGYTEGTKVNLYLFITRGINTDKTRTLVSTYYKRPDQKESLKASPQVLQSVQEPSYLKQASHGNLILFLLKQQKARLRSSKSCCM